VAQWKPTAGAGQPYHLKPGGTFEVTPMTPAGADNETGELPVYGKPMILIPGPDGDTSVAVVQTPETLSEVVRVTGSAAAGTITFRSATYETVEAFAAAVTAKPPRALTVTAEASVPFGRIQQVIRIARKAGITTVSIAVQKAVQKE
jgi:biopolymer transport protein ExbD